MKSSTKTAQSIVGTSKGRPETDFYPTPSHAVEALLSVEDFEPSIWECACGNGAISQVLSQHKFFVVSSDLYDYFYGYSGIDFLKVGPEYMDVKFPTTIITNPPFNQIEEFIYHSIHTLKAKKVCFLAKLALLEGQKRSKLLESTPLKNVWVFRKRLTMTRNGEPQRSSGMIAFAWYVWEQGYTGKPQIGWI